MQNIKQVTKFFGVFLFFAGIFFIWTSNVFAADRYWVGGSGDWSDDDNHWATESEGLSSDGNLPTIEDNVIFDSNSHTTSYTVTLEDGASADCANMTWGNPASGSPALIATDGSGYGVLNVYGSLTLVSGMTFDLSNDNSSGYLNFLATSGTKTITTNGATVDVNSFTINGNDATFQFEDDLITTGRLDISAGTLDANNHNVTVGSFIISTTGPTTIVMGSGTWIVTGSSINGIVSEDGGVITFVPGASTIKFTDATGSPKVFMGGGKTYNDIWFTGAGTGNYYIHGSNTFNDFKDDGTEAHSILFGAGSIQTVSSWDINGSAEKMIALNSDNGLNQFTVSKSSGAVNSSYVILENSVATGGATFTADYSANDGNNTGWAFTNEIDISSRYWVGGPGDWTDDDNHWALSSGGNPANGNLPTTETNCVIDSSSGLSGGTITLDTSGYCKDFTSNSGHSYTITDGDLNNFLIVSGSLTLESGVTFDIFSINFWATSPGKTITTAGAIISSRIGIGYAGGEGGWILQDDLTTSLLDLVSGTFDANGHNITTVSGFSFRFGIGLAPTVIMGSGTWEATGDGAIWRTTQIQGRGEGSGEMGVIAIVPETSTIKLSGEDTSFYLGGKTFNNIWFDGNGAIYGSNTFNDFKISPGKTVNFYGTTQMVSSFTAVGMAESIITLDSGGVGSIQTGHIGSAGTGYVVSAQVNVDGGSGAVLNVDSVDENGGITNVSIINPGTDYSAGGQDLSFFHDGENATYIIDTTTDQFTLTKSGGDKVGVNYVNISNSNVTPADTWYYGPNSVYVGPESFSEPNFATHTKWSASGDFVYDENGHLIFPGDLTQTGEDMAIPLVAGAYYTFGITISDFVGSAVVAIVPDILGNTGSVTPLAFSADGTYTGSVASSVSNGDFNLLFYLLGGDDCGDDCYFTSLSIVSVSLKQTNWYNNTGWTFDDTAPAPEPEHRRSSSGGRSVNVPPPSTTPAVIPGCDNRTTGFSVASGVSCALNLGNGNQNENQGSGSHGPYNFGTTTLRNGSWGEAVKELQRFLNAELNLDLVIDGILGPKTIAAIKQWQQNHGLVVDGLVGPLTKAMMNSGQ